MKSIKLYLSVLLVVLLLSLQGCHTHYHTIGNGPVGRTTAKKLVSSTKAVYLFGGLIGLGNTASVTPPGGEKDFQIKTSTNFVDFFVAILTSNVVTLRTVKVYVNAKN